MDEKERVFHDLYVEYHEILYKTCISFTGNPVKADEIVQEAFIRLWIVWDERIKCTLSANKSWLYKAVMNIIHEMQRTDMRHPDDIDELTDTPAEDSIRARDEILQYEHYLSVIQRILKPKEYRVFELYVVNGMTYSEMAVVLKKRESTIRSEISRLRKKLRPAVEKLLKEK